jgi:hypothetical protein
VELAISLLPHITGGVFSGLTARCSRQAEPLASLPEAGAMGATVGGVAAWRIALFVVILGVGIGLSLTTFEDTGDRATIWRIIYWYGAALIVTSPLARDARSFFMGQSLASWMGGITAVCKGVVPAAVPGAVTLSKVDRAKAIPTDREQKRAVGFWTLMPSAFITWIFAKSIYNASVLGGRFGLLGGFGYASWYLSFWTAAAVGYVLRTRHGQGSLPRALNKAYGPVASFCFGVALLFRLWNEVWSNATVVANFYGEPLSAEWWGAVVLSAGVPLSYVLLGGMYSSLISDAIQVRPRPRPTPPPPRAIQPPSPPRAPLAPHGTAPFDRRRCLASSSSSSSSASWAIGWPVG